MSADIYIKKRQPDPDGLDFAGLRQQGLALLQELAGEVWTDYNLHDPGVTLLETLCYVLTDMLYRCSFDVADYLLDDSGQIDYAQQALYRPDQILPCQAVTEQDYRKLLLSEIPNIDNIWIARVDNQLGDATGLYRFFVQLNERVVNQDNEGVRNAYAGMVRKTYAAHRNLCEDLESVTFVERVYFSLQGKIEIDGRRDAAQVLAEVYFVCAQYLSPQVPIKSYAEMYRAGKPLETLFEGVLTERGFIDEADLYPWQGYFSIADLLTRVQQINGVRHVSWLSFVDAQGQARDHIMLQRQYGEVAALLLPTQQEQIGIALVRSDKLYQVALRDVLLEFKRQTAHVQIMRQQKQHFDWVATLLPSGVQRALQAYYPLQNHLPDVYGMNAYGVPDSESDGRKAQAAQLKGYLLFFEQVLADFAQQLQQIKRLYSRDEQLGQSYFYQILQPDSVAQVDKLYQPGLTHMPDAWAQQLASLDHYRERRNRALDYLLALYGEKFNQHTLQRYFSCEQDSAQQKIANKLRFLDALPKLSQNRATRSGLQQKLCLLLGISDIQVVEHILLRQQHSDWDDAFYPHRLSLFLLDNQPDSEFGKFVEETVCLNCPAHIYPEIFWLAASTYAEVNWEELDRATLMTLRGEHATSSH